MKDRYVMFRVRQGEVGEGEKEIESKNEMEDHAAVGENETRGMVADKDIGVVGVVVVDDDDDDDDDDGHPLVGFARRAYSA